MLGIILMNIQAQMLSANMKSIDIGIQVAEQALLLSIDCWYTTQHMRVKNASCVKKEKSLEYVWLL